MSDYLENTPVPAEGDDNVKGGNAGKQLQRRGNSPVKSLPIKSILIHLVLLGNLLVKRLINVPALPVRNKRDTSEQNKSHQRYSQSQPIPPFSTCIHQLTTLLAKAAVHHQYLLKTAVAFILVVNLLQHLQCCTASDHTPTCNPQPPSCMPCDGTLYYYESRNNSCQKCPFCLPGFQPDRNCGEDGKGEGAVCIPCSNGTFSEVYDQGMCSTCQHCDNTVNDTQCTNTSDRTCGPCAFAYGLLNKNHKGACIPCEYLGSIANDQDSCKSQRKTIAKTTPMTLTDRMTERTEKQTFPDRLQSTESLEAVQSSTLHDRMIELPLIRTTNSPGTPLNGDGVRSTHFKDVPLSGGNSVDSSSENQPIYQGEMDPLFEIDLEAIKPTSSNEKPAVNHHPGAAKDGDKNAFITEETLKFIILSVLVALIIVIMLIAVACIKCTKYRPIMCEKVRRNAVADTYGLGSQSLSQGAPDKVPNGEQIELRSISKGKSRQQTTLSQRSSNGNNEDDSNFEPRQQRSPLGNHSLKDQEQSRASSGCTSNFPTTSSDTIASHTSDSGIRRNNESKTSLHSSSSSSALLKSSDSPDVTKRSQNFSTPGALALHTGGGTPGQNFSHCIDMSAARSDDKQSSYHQNVGNEETEDSPCSLNSQDLPRKNMSVIAEKRNTLREGSDATNNKSNNVIPEDNPSISNSLWNSNNNIRQAVQENAAEQVINHGSYNDQQLHIMAGDISGHPWNNVNHTPSSFARQDSIRLPNNTMDTSNAGQRIYKGNSMTGTFPLVVRHPESQTQFMQQQQQQQRQIHQPFEAANQIAPMVLTQIMSPGQAQHIQACPYLRSVHSLGNRVGGGNASLAPIVQIQNTIPSELPSSTMSVNSQNDPNVAFTARPTLYQRPPPTSEPSVFNNNGKIEHRAVDSLSGYQNERKLSPLPTQQAANVKTALSPRLSPGINPERVPMHSTSGGTPNQSSIIQASVGNNQDLVSGSSTAQSAKATLPNVVDASTSPRPSPEVRTAAPIFNDCVFHGAVVNASNAQNSSFLIADKINKNCK